MNKDLRLITVLMSVYNGEPFLRQAIDSILAQSFTDFEFLILDDGSQDHSLEVMRDYTDSRVRVVVNDRNRGLPATLNRGLALAAGAYIARMDQDDIAHPERLQRQFAFMESHPAVGVCGTWMRYFDSERRVWRPPVSDAAIRVRMLFDCPLAHPSVMLRTDLLRKHKLQYSEDCRKCEDYRFWMDWAPWGEFYNLPEVLMHYRVHEKQMCVTSKPQQQVVADRIRLTYLEQTLGMALSATEGEAFMDYVHGRRDLALDRLQAIGRLTVRMLEANESRQAFAPVELNRELARRWVRVCRRSKAGAGSVWRQFSASPLYRKTHAWEKLQVGVGVIGR